MKTVTYRDETYEVPEWVKYIATDSNGSIYGYEYEPAKFNRQWMMNAKYAEQRVHCILDKLVDDWDLSLACYDE